MARRLSASMLTAVPLSAQSLFNGLYINFRFINFARAGTRQIAGEKTGKEHWQIKINA